MHPRSGYVSVNGLRMFYELHGDGGTPLVLIHGGGSTIGTNFGRVLPLLSGSRRVIAVEAGSLPVTRGQTLGRVQIFQRGKLVGESALVASRSVARPGLAGRAGWYARRTLHHMWGWVT